MPRLFITGGTGYLGRRLITAFLDDGYTCTVVSRSGRNPWQDQRVTVLTADPTKAGSWQDAAAGADVVVNLAGARIVDPPQRWTAARKRILRGSRIDTTHRVAEAIARAERPPILLSGSAVGYYGSRGDTVLDESAPAGDGFLARLCVEWEGGALDVADRTRVVVLRTAPVLGPGAAFLDALLTPFKLGLGGPWGPGTQWLPWVHVDDVVQVVRWAAAGDVSGPVNVAAPEPVTVRTFASTLGDVLHRPAFVPLPTVALRLALGEAADALLDSQRVVPRRVTEAGFAFRFAALRPALEASV